METTDDAPTSGLLGRVQAKLSERHPLVAQSLARVSGIEVAGEKLVFRFPSTAALFAQRVKDPEMLPVLKEVTGIGTRSPIWSVA